MADPWAQFKDAAPADPWAQFADAPAANGNAAPAQPQSENVFQRAARLTGEAYQGADQAYRKDIQSATHNADGSLKPVSLLDTGKVAMDVLGAATSPIKGVMDATFGDKPIALPFGVNSKGLTGGDIAGFVLPAASEASAARGLANVAKGMGVTERTAEATLAASKGITAPEVVKPQSALGKVLAPYVAANSQKAAETQAGQRLAAAATDPQAAVNALGQPAEIVPGSQPTTFQQTGDMGLGALERQTATADPAAFQQRAAEQNSARRAALGGVEPAGDPNDVAKALKQQFDDLNAEHDAKVDAAAKIAQDRAAGALGPEEAPEATGRAVRGALVDAQDTAKARWGELYGAVDPDGTLTANTQATSAAARSIPEDVASTAKPLSGEAKAVFDVAEALPPLAPLRDLMALKVRISDAMAEAKVAGDLQSHRLLTQLRGAIDDNLSNSIGHEVVSEARQVGKGVLDPSDTLAARLQSQADEWHAQRTAGADGSQGLPQGGAEGSPATAGILRAEGAPVEGQGSPVGAQGVSAAPSVDAEASQRLNAADATFKAEAPGFRTGPVGDVLKTNGRKDDFRLPDGSVAVKFFHPGKAAFDHMQALIAKAGDAVLPVIERFAATTLRRAALKADGTLDPAKFAQWQKAYGDALRALPAETRAKYASASRASEALADVTAERATALKVAQQGAIGKVMGLSSPEDVTRTVGSILGGRTAVADMKALAKATASNPEARQGLRRAITDFIANKLVSNTEAATSGETLLKADAYQTFVRQNRAALHLVFSPEEVRTMEAVGEDIQRAKRSQNAVRLPGQSNTAQDSRGDLAKTISDAVGRSWLHVLGAGLGAHFGPFGAAAGALTAHLVQAVRARGIARVDQLVSEAMLDPKLAKALLTKAPRKSTNWNAGSAPVTAALWATSAGQSTKDNRQ